MGSSWTCSACTYLRTMYTLGTSSSWAELTSSNPICLCEKALVSTSCLTLLLPACLEAYQQVELLSQSIVCSTIHCCESCQWLCQFLAPCCTAFLAATYCGNCRPETLCRVCRNCGVSWNGSAAEPQVLEATAALAATLSTPATVLSVYFYSVKVLVQQHSKAAPATPWSCGSICKLRQTVQRCRSDNATLKAAESGTRSFRVLF